MRAEELALLLLSVAFLLVVGARFFIAEQESAPSPDASATGPWQYDSRAPYFSYLPRDVRTFHANAPAEVAGRVCAAMGGRLHFLRAGLPAARSRVGFNCVFQESAPDMTISADFGDLRRIPTPTK